MRISEISVIFVLQLITSVQESKARPVTFRKIVMKMSVLKPILVCLGIMFFTTMSGYDAVTFYTVDIFHSAGATVDPRYSTIILGVIQVVSCDLILNGYRELPQQSSM